MSSAEPVAADQYAAYLAWNAGTDHNIYDFAGATQWTYDALGRELSQTLPSLDGTTFGPTESSTYDQYGRLSQTTDFDGNFAVYTYYTDFGSGHYCGQVKQIVYSGAGQTTQTVSYTYDSLGRQLTVTDNSGTTTYAYDNFGNVSSAATPEGWIHYHYNNLNQLDQVWTGTTSSNSPNTSKTNLSYYYDTLGRLESVVVTRFNAHSAGLETDYAYDADGNLAMELLPDGVTSTYSYNHLNYLTDLVQTNAQGQVMLSEHYTLNPDGTRSSLREAQLQADGSTLYTQTNWTYDTLGRLLSETLTNTATAALIYADSYSYDLSSNRVGEIQVTPSGTETTSYSYNGNDELTYQVDNVSGTTDFYYDNNGSQKEMVQIPLTGGTVTTSYTYDARNRMSSVTSPSDVTTSYVYDDAGNRVQETVGSSAAVYYLTDTANPTGYAQPIEQRASKTSAPTETYLIGDRVFGQVGSVTGATPTYLHTDGHGSTQQLTDSSGNVTAAFMYDAFGGAIGGWSPALAGTIFLFGGDAVYDAASGLYLHGDGIRRAMGFRFIEMDSTQGSNQDPITLHKYLYADGDPVNGIDPSGHFDLFELGIVGTINAISFAVITSPIITAAAQAVALISLVEFVVNPDYRESIIAATGGDLSQLTEVFSGSINYFANATLNLAAATATAKFVSEFAPAVGDGASALVLDASAMRTFFLARGLPQEAAEGFSSSFSGGMGVLREVKAGESFLRYSGPMQKLEGSFLTNTAYDTASEATEALDLAPRFGNDGSLVQRVTANQDTYVIAGGVANGAPGAYQAIAVSQNAFTYGPRVPTGSKP